MLSVYKIIQERLSENTKRGLLGAGAVLTGIGISRAASYYSNEGETPSEKIKIGWNRFIGNTDHIQYRDLQSRIDRLESKKESAIKVLERFKKDTTHPSREFINSTIVEYEKNLQKFNSEIAQLKQEQRKYKKD